MNKKIVKEGKINEALRHSIGKKFGIIDSDFLMKSISILCPASSTSVGQEASVQDVMRALKTEKLGCISVVDQDEKLVGIFSERDYVLKVYEVPGEGKTSIKTYMTSDPVTITATDSIGFALSLMSQGGFRHLPIVDDDNVPVGMLSVKNIVDYIAEGVVDDILDFKVELVS